MVGLPGSALVGLPSSALVGLGNFHGSASPKCMVGLSKVQGWTSLECMVGSSQALKGFYLNHTGIGGLVIGGLGDVTPAISQSSNNLRLFFAKKRMEFPSTTFFVPLVVKNT